VMVQVLVVGLIHLLKMPIQYGFNTSSQNPKNQ